MSAADPKRYTTAEYDAIAARVSNWGRWGTEDELGTLHFLTDECRRAGAALVQDGVVVSCGQDIDLGPRVDSPRPSMHTPFWVREELHGAALEVLTLEPHGYVMTHLDALNHMNYRGRMYNDRPVEPYVEDGLDVCSVMRATDGISGRAVLIDLPPVLGRPWMEPAEIATFDDVQRAIERQGVEVRRGDIVLIRTGRVGRARERGIVHPDEGLPGIALDCADWVHDTEMASIITDAGIDPQPSEVEDVRVPWHVLTLVMMGMPITDNADLEQLAQECERRRRWEFFLVLSPLRVPRANSSPVNPLAFL